MHVCRTVCRRVERHALRVDDANPEIVRYLNRLSDPLFILGRAANRRMTGRSFVVYVHGGLIVVAAVLLVQALRR